jgi:hypothetical protein
VPVSGFRTEQDSRVAYSVYLDDAQFTLRGKEQNYIKHYKVHSDCVTAVRSAFPRVIKIPVILADRSDGSFMLDEAIVRFLHCTCSCRDTASFPYRVTFLGGYVCKKIVISN